MSHEQQRLADYLAHILEAIVNPLALGLSK